MLTPGASRPPSDATVSFIHAKLQRVRKLLQSMLNKKKRGHLDFKPFLVLQFQFLKEFFIVFSAEGLMEHQQLLLKVDR